MSAEPADAAPPASGSLRLGSIVARLTSVNALVMAFGLLTGPLLARSLGPSGRGAVAAVAAPLALAPYVLGIGLVTFVVRESARGRSTGELLGSVGLIYCVIGLIAVVLARPAAVYFAQGRAPVRVALLIGFYCMPIFLIGMLLLAIANGRQRWTMVISTRLLPAVIGLVATTALYALGILNVSEAIAIVLASNLVAIVPTLGVLREALPLKVRGSVIRESFRFGLPSWLWQISLLTNGRLDQVLMVTLTTSSQLGLYAVAVSLAGVSNVFSSALGPALLPRVTKGETAVVARASSTTLAVSIVMNIGLALACPVVLPLLFGASFRNAVPMAWILMAAAVPNTGTQVLTASLLSAGRPRLVAAGELTAVGITVGGLLFLVGPLGGVGAALVSLAAYAVTFGILAVGAMREFRLPLRELIVPTRHDLLAQGVLVWRLLTRMVRCIPARLQRREQSG
jgi:O-antigen/teichoic acid export membrane protein